MVGLDRLHELVADAVEGMQRRQRVLEDHRDLLAADARASRRRDACSRSLPPKWISPVILEIFERVSPITVSEDTDLPEPDSPTIPSVRPGADVVGDAVDRLDEAVVGVEVDVQVADGEERLGHDRRTRGSRTEYMMSTSRLQRQTAKRQEERRALHGDDVAALDRVEGEAPDAGDVEDALGEDRAADEDADVEAEDGDDRRQRGAQRRGGRSRAARRAPWRAPCGCSPRPAPRAGWRAAVGRRSRRTRSRARTTA